MKTVVQRPERTDSRTERATIRPVTTELRLERAYSMLERTDLRVKGWLEV